MDRFLPFKYAHKPQPRRCLPIQRRNIQDNLLDITSLLSAINGNGRNFIQTHNFPDPDAIASAYGLQAFLRHHGINAGLCYKGSIDNMGIKHVIQAYGIDILEYGQIPDMSFADKIILVDGQKFNSNMTDLPGDEVACIDHHPDNSKCEYAYVDIRSCGACANIITHYFSEASIPLDQKTATLLLYGLQKDTDNMTRGVTEMDIDAFRTLFLPCQMRPC